MSVLLLAGATGTLGRALVHQLAEQRRPTRLLVRRPEALPADLPHTIEVVLGEVTQPETLVGVMDGVGAVLSTVGITRQRDGLTYDQVDYGANRNLLDAALAAGVPRFGYVSVLGGRALRHIALCAAKERFVDDLTQADIESVVIRPTGFYTDLAAFVAMAKRDRAWIFGDGQRRLNPIHPEDLAVACLRALDAGTPEAAVGGPEVLTHEAIARLAFEAVGWSPVVTPIPDLVRRAALAVARRLPATWAGPAAFFLAMMGRDQIAPTFGERHLRDFFHKVAYPTPSGAPDYAAA
ncbi:MAG: SDR family oxidoreductase [Bacteroidota bacterium]